MKRLDATIVGYRFWRPWWSRKYRVTSVETGQTWHPSRPEIAHYQAVIGELVVATFDEKSNLEECIVYTYSRFVAAVQNRGSLPSVLFFGKPPKEVATSILKAVRAHQAQTKKPKLDHDRVLWEVEQHERSMAILRRKIRDDNPRS